MSSSKDQGDRYVLERARARELCFTYFLMPTETRNSWLATQLKYTEKVYGKGSGERVKALMGQIKAERESPVLHGPGVVPCINLYVPPEKKRSR